MNIMLLLLLLRRLLLFNKLMIDNDNFPTPSDNL